MRNRGLSVNGTTAFARRSLAFCLIPLVFGCGYAANDSSLESPEPASHVRLEATPVENGAELLTLFVSLPQDQSAHYGEMPVLSVLRDTLGSDDPQTARLRDVWLLTAGNPSLIRRVESALPFLYWIHTPKPSTSVQPVRLIDFGSTAGQTEGALAAMLIQGSMLDGAGRTLRTTSRSWRMNDAEDRSARAAEAMAALAEAEDQEQTPGALSDDLARLHARLLLSDAVLGGLVRNQTLLPYHDRQQTERVIARGHNWDLVRQAAEADRLYFEPLSFNRDEAAWAMLWVRSQDLHNPPPGFDGKLLHIANPFHDGRLARWRGYTERWWFDENGRRVEEGAPGAIADDVLPLALYSLDHPHLPLLLVDFQNSGKPRLRENTGRAAEEVTRGVLGLSPIANWNYFVGRSMVLFVLRRHGDVSDRTARVRSWAELSYALSTGDQIRPGLREALQHYVHAPVFDAQREKVDAEAALAWQRYRLLTGANSPVPEFVQKRRQSELTADDHARMARFGYALAHLATLGAWNHQETTDNIESDLAWRRRLQFNRDFLDRVARSSPRVEVTWDVARVRASVDEIQHVVEQHPTFVDNVSPVLARLTANTEDDELRHACLRALNGIDSDEARRQLASLSRHSDRFDCPVCRDYLAHKTPAPTAGASGPVAGLQ